MVADSKGRDVAAAPVYVTGAAAFAPVLLANVISKADLGNSSKALPVAFRFMGLRTSDGGPEASTDAGDAIEFLESGFELGGDGSISVKMTLAQLTPTTRELINGIAPDSNGVIEVKSITPDTTFILYLESVFKNGQIERQEGVARISEVAVGKEERSSVKGIEVTFKWLPHDLFNGAHYWDAVITPGAPVPSPGK